MDVGLVWISLNDGKFNKGFDLPMVSIYVRSREASFSSISQIEFFRRIKREFGDANR